jgi:hypothetical protein
LRVLFLREGVSCE